MTIIAEVSQEEWKSIREATDDIMQKKPLSMITLNIIKSMEILNYCDNNIIFFTVNQVLE